MPTTRVEIPKISNRRLGYLARIIRPVVSLVVLPLGKWPQDEVRTYFKKLPKDLRCGNFLAERCLGQAHLVKEKQITTLHVPGSAGRVFCPTIAEVLAQIPASYLDKKVPSGNRIVAFETFLPNRDPEYDESGHFHKATTVLLVKASPGSGELMRFHY